MDKKMDRGSFEEKGKPTNGYTKPFVGKKKWSR